MNVIGSIVVYTINKSGKQFTGFGFEMKTEGMTKDILKYNLPFNYGTSMLLELIVIVDKMLLVKSGVYEPRTIFRLITGQTQSKSVCTKLFELYLDCISNNITQIDDIKKLVLKRGRYTARPNDELYAELVLKLLGLYDKHLVTFDYVHKPNPTTLRLVKELHQVMGDGTKLVKNKSKNTGNKNE